MGPAAGPGGDGVAVAAVVVAAALHYHLSSATRRAHSQA